MEEVDAGSGDETKVASCVASSRCRVTTSEDATSTCSNSVVDVGRIVMAEGDEREDGRAKVCEILEASADKTRREEAVASTDARSSDQAAVTGAGRSRIRKGSVCLVDRTKSWLFDVVTRTTSSSAP